MRVDYTEKFKLRFWSKVDRSGGNDACWNWTGAKFNTGYGTIGFNYQNLSTHRVSFSLINGEIPQGLLVLHSCDNRLCVNPQHLRLGTYQDNINDAKNRHRNVISKNEKNGQCRISDAIVRELRTRYEMGNISGRALAEEFNISSQHVNDIVQYRVRTP